MRGRAMPAPPRVLAAPLSAFDVATVTMTDSPGVMGFIAAVPNTVAGRKSANVGAHHLHLQQSYPCDPPKTTS